MEMMADLHGPDYELTQTFCEPADVGFAGSSRPRTYVIGAHSQKTTMLKDPLELQEMLKSSLKRVKTKPEDYLVSTRTEVQLEALSLARRRKIQYLPHTDDLSYLLLPREQDAVRGYSAEFTRRFGLDPAQQDGLFYYLGDNPGYALSWSAHGRLPTFRMSKGLLWSPKLRRWLTAKERLTSLAWPVTPSLSTGMAVPEIPAMDIQRASDLAGNGMHFLNSAVQQLIALSCFGPQGCSDIDMGL